MDLLCWSRGTSYYSRNITGFPLRCLSREEVKDGSMSTLWNSKGLSFVNFRGSCLLRARLWSSVWSRSFGSI